VLAGRHGPAHRLGHLDLPRPFLTAEGLDGTGEDLLDGRGALGHRRTLTGPADKAGPVVHSGQTTAPVSLGSRATFFFLASAFGSGHLRWNHSESGVAVNTEE
jgi:hypothetical protein